MRSSERSGAAAFLDRDGVLNGLVRRGDVAVSPRTLAEFHVLPTAAPAVDGLRRLGLRVFVVTNQPDIARGLMDPGELTSMNEELVRRVRVDDVAVCPHDDAAACACRKPKAGMLLALAERWAVDLRRSFMIGDSWKDIEAGRRAGCRTILVAHASTSGIAPDFVVPDLPAAVEAIERSLRVAASNA
jgi:D-glycero-D-manno-heptose 1,7-bisphosphate phosphatase